MFFNFFGNVAYFDLVFWGGGGVRWVLLRPEDGRVVTFDRYRIYFWSRPAIRSHKSRFTVDTSYTGTGDKPGVW